MTSGVTVVESAEAVTRTILTTYSHPNKSSPELQELILNRTFVDPLLAFSELCRSDLRDVHSSGDAGQATSNLLGMPGEVTPGARPVPHLRSLFPPGPERLLGRVHQVG
jgi:hypothetical protein